PVPGSAENSAAEPNQAQTGWAPAIASRLVREPPAGDESRCLIPDPRAPPPDVANNTTRLLPSPNHNHPAGSRKPDASFQSNQAAHVPAAAALIHRANRRSAEFSVDKQALGAYSCRPFGQRHYPSVQYRSDRISSV